MVGEGGMSVLSGIVRGIAPVVPLALSLLAVGRGGVIGVEDDTLCESRSLEFELEGGEGSHVGAVTRPSSSLCLCSPFPC